jgi:DNA-binding transcriptional LysR family regulator
MARPLQGGPSDWTDSEEAAMRLNELDIRLLRILQILLAECSVSRTADLLGLSQPAVSAALKRLRRAAGDQLLVRSGLHLVPTERGLEIKETLDLILAQLGAAFSPDSGFDPATTERCIRIVGADCLGILFLPRIVELVRRDAPRARIELCRMPGDDDIGRLLEEGTTDVVIGNWPTPPDTLRVMPLLETDIVCVMRPGHPLARGTAEPRLDLATYLAADHLSPTPPASAAVSPIDGRLGQIHRPRRVAVTVPEYAVVPHVLAGDDLIFTSGRPFAESMAALTPLVVAAAPPELGRMAFYMLWHERQHHAPYGRWLRGLVRRATADIRAADTADLADGARPDRRATEHA